MCGRLVEVWRLRIGEREGLDAELAAEVDSGGVEWLAAGCRPEVELIARLVASETAEQMPRNMNREATVPAPAVRAEWT